jgi:mannosyl-3-phosphoglycerate phosphatase
MGASDKGRAVDLVTQLYARGEHRPLVVALGDAPNDVPMLAHADRPVLVRRPEGDWHEDALRELAQADPRGSITLTRGFGPAGWNEAVSDVLRSIEDDAPPRR